MKSKKKHRHTPEGTASSAASFVIKDGVLQKYTGSGGNVVIPSSVTTICQCAFSDCSSLTGVTIPNSVTSICDYAFSGCSSLTSITIPNSVTRIGYSAFSDCSSLTKVTIPNSVTHIGGSVFLRCSGLTKVTIPSSVTIIGESAFSDCSSLTKVTIPNSVTCIETSAFSGCSGLTRLCVTSGNPKYHSQGNCLIATKSKLLVVGCRTSVIPVDGSVTGIGDYAFSGCSSLTSITIPKSVTSIGEYAFSGCSSLTSITIPKSVTYIGQEAFSGCSSLNPLPTIPPVRIEDAVKVLRGEILERLAEHPSVSYKLASLHWGDATSCFPDAHYKWDCALFHLYFIEKKLGATLDMYSSWGVPTPSRFIPLSASAFHQIAKRYHMHPILQAFQSEEDWAMLFDESLDGAIASARAVLQKQEEAKNAAAPKKPV